MNAVTRRGLVLAVVCLVGIGFADCFISTSLQLQTGSSALLRQSGMSLRRAQGAASRAVFPGRSARGCRCSIASGEMVETQEKTASRTAISPAEAKERLQKLQDADQDGDKWNKEEVTTVLDSMKDGENGIVWNSVPMLYRRCTLNELRMLTRGTIKEGTLDLNGDDDMEVLNISFYATLISSMFLSTVAAVAVPDMPQLAFFRGEILRYVITFGIGSLPFAFLGAGLSVPGLLQAALIQGRRLLSKEFRQRLVYHEAGHFLVGYCMGLPVAGYQANDSILNACQFFPPDEGIAGRLQYDEVDRLCAVSMGGVVAEAMRFGEGVGGFADLTQLQGLISRATPRLDDKGQQERVRWGCVSAYTTLKRHEKALDALADAMMAGATVAECVELIERFGRDLRD
eukprot:CAMPEP_0177690788 /NCGR_PEP_ID=MMETSP0484_2-20121128/954_1 /TAXON_ID=354590 /ORGANISM="Rhodomonas lens, Strain RHODO" /LENGTH=399 /DNA_ID=CAMNT_0019201357 /DNA_START=17 /DNA_END=1216 /DNA_ORIENTATION=+